MPSSRIEVHNGKYIDDQMANGVPDGGTTGQVLAKASNDDYDTEWVTGGGGTSPLTTKGDIYTYSTTDTRLPVGLDTQILIADSTTATGLKWGSNTTPTATGYYGAWQDNLTQTAAASNVGYAMIFRIIDLSNGVTVVTDGTNLTRITFANTGVYNLQFSSQFQNLSNAPQDVTIWLRKNGTDVSGSSGFIGLEARKNPSDPYHIIASWNYLLDVIGGDYYQLIWSTTDHTNVTMSYYPAGNPPPLTASVILTVTQQSGILAGTGITAINSLSGAVQTLVTGTSGTDFAISSSGTSHTFNLPIASATNTGKLSNTDWSNFNTAYTNRITSLTTTGSSGSATLVSNTLNIPTYTLSGLGGQPLSTNLTSLSGLSYASASFVKMTASGTFSLDTSTYQTSLTFSTGLTNGSGTVTSNLSVGVSGGQSVIGGTASGNSLTLSSTSNATKGKILFGTSGYDEANNRLGLGTQSPGTIMQIALTNTDYTNTNGAGSHIYMTNGSATGQNVVSSFINGSMVAKWRTDYVGNISWVAGSSGAHDFYTKGDFGTGQIMLRIFNGGNVQVATSPVGGANSDAGYKLDVQGTGRYTGALLTAGRRQAYSSKSANYTLTSTDEIIAVDASGAARTMTLPTAVSVSGATYTIKKTDSSANAVTVATTSSQTIDGSTTYSLATQYKYVTVSSNGANWLIISNN